MRELKKKVSKGMTVDIVNSATNQSEVPLLTEVRITGGNRVHLALNLPRFLCICLLIPLPSFFALSQLYTSTIFLPLLVYRRKFSTSEKGTRG